MRLLAFFSEEVRELAAQGGWLFWALLALAFGIAIALISIVQLIRVSVCGDGSLFEQQVFDKIERRIRFVFVLIGTAPLVGLLGTVSGMLATFHGLAGFVDRAPMEVISGGISEALITTQTGLVIAVPSFIFATMLNSHLKQLRFASLRRRAAVRRTNAAEFQSLEDC